jgi:hypothetical protein
MKKITFKQHKNRHKFLHKCFDELLADYLYNTKISLSKIKMLKFVEWSYQQTITPTEILKKISGKSK